MVTAMMISWRGLTLPKFLDPHFISNEQDPFNHIIIKCKEIHLASVYTDTGWVVPWDRFHGCEHSDRTILWHLNMD